MFLSKPYSSRSLSDLNGLLRQFGIEKSFTSKKEILVEIEKVRTYFNNIKDGNKEPEEYKEWIAEEGGFDESPAWLCRAFVLSKHIYVPNADLTSKKWVEEAKKLIQKDKVTELSEKGLFNQLTKMVGENKCKLLLDKLDGIDVVLTYFPSIDTSKNDDFTEEKIELLNYDLDLFLAVAVKISDVPDQRKISGETASRMKIEEWNPWKTLFEEIEVLSGAEKRGDTEHLFIYHFLLSTQKVEKCTVGQYERLIREESIDFIRENGPIKKGLLYQIFYTNAIKSAKCDKQFKISDILNPFFVTYPVLSFVLLQSQFTMPLAIFGDHPSTLEIISLKPIKLWQFASHTSNQGVVDALLDGKTTEEVSEADGITLQMSRWLVSNHKDPQSLLPMILGFDDLQSFCKIVPFKERKDKLLTAIKRGASAILSHIRVSMSPECQL